MKKIDPKSEKLSELLLQADDELANEVYLIDSAEKLKQQIKTETPTSKLSFIREPAFVRAIAAVLCLAFTVGVFSAVAPMFRNNGGDILLPPTENTPPSNPQGNDPNFDLPPKNNGNFNALFPTESLHINNLDMLNYYAAVRFLTDNSAFSNANFLTSPSPYPTFDLLSSGRNSDGYTFLANEELSESGYDVSSVDIDSSAPNDDRPSEPADDEKENEEIYYYEFEPDQLFSINKVWFFRVELTDETGFLASKLGTGIVDVVISEEFLWGDDLITLKNGDRYYSCLTNGWSAHEGGGLWEFSTHKFIEGFHVVKNFEQENYHFNVDYFNDQIQSFECSVWDNGTNPDGFLNIVGETVVSEVNVRCTIDELEDYFNSALQFPKVPDVSNDNSDAYTDETEGDTFSNNEDTSITDMPDIFYYEIYPDEIFDIQKVWMFKSELTDAPSFLTEKIGTGIIDVMVIDDFIWDDAIIILKNGDRYYSCLTNSSGFYDGSGSFEFATHKFIEGSRVVKNFKQENYLIKVSFFQDQADSFTYEKWKYWSGPCVFLPILSKTVVVDVNKGYKINELEDLLNNDLQYPSISDVSSIPDESTTFEEPTIFDESTIFEESTLPEEYNFFTF